MLSNQPTDFRHKCFYTISLVFLKHLIICLDYPERLFLQIASSNKGITKLFLFLC